MKIKIEPTVLVAYHDTVTIETTKDDLSVDDFFEVVKKLALAWGYEPDSIKEVFNEPTIPRS